MSKPLVIVESPSKAKTISRYLKGKYVVKASVGHIRDLPKSKLGVDVENDFNPTYEILNGKEDIVEELRKAADKADDIYLAADPDREGEAICWHLRELIGDGKMYHRVVMNQITKSAITEAFSSPIELDMNKVYAQQTRRIIDRLVGYKISPLLWDKVRRGLSAGRVQSVAVKMVCDREKEINKFKPEEFWNIEVLLSAKEKPTFIAKLVKEEGKKCKIDNGDKAGEVVKILEKAEYKVHSVKKRSKKKNPNPPFITSKLQQAGSTRLGYTVRKTMSVAQKLYEGKEIGGEEGPVGLITYMRTDSVRTAPDALEEVREYISKEFKAEYLPEKPNMYKSKKSAQDAHEAIRPTSVYRTPDSIKQYLTSEEYKVYKLIWEQFVASQMTSALFDTTSVEVEADRFLLRASGSILKFDGYQKVLKTVAKKKASEDENEADESEKIMPPMEAGDPLKKKKLDSTQHFTQPPPRYNEASLVKELENNGIGRPSTFAAIVSTIQNRKYVDKEERRFKPTELGVLVNELLEGSFVDIMKLEYTANLEINLDKVEAGEKEWVALLEEFYNVFEDRLEKAKKEMRNIKTEETPTDEVCEKCGKGMIIKWGRHGKFLACSGYPDCRNTREIFDGMENPPDEDGKHECPNCGKDMVLRRGRWGYFLACNGYPECKTTESVDPKTFQKKDLKPVTGKCPECDSDLVRKFGKFGEFIACSAYPKCKYVKQNLIGMKCPLDDCDGDLVEKKNKRGTNFYGCTKYPDCKFAAPGKPIPKACPDCGNNYLIEKTLKKKGTVHVCYNKECDYEIVIAPPEDSE